MKISLKRGFLAVLFSTAFVHSSLAQIQLNTLTRSVSGSLQENDPVTQRGYSSPDKYASSDTTGSFSHSITLAHSLSHAQAQCTLSQNTSLTLSPDYVQFGGTLHLDATRSAQSDPNLGNAAVDLDLISIATLGIHVTQPARFSLAAHASYALEYQTFSAFLRLSGGTVATTFVGDQAYNGSGPSSVNISGTLPPGDYLLDLSVGDTWEHGDEIDTTRTDDRTLTFSFVASAIPDHSTDYVLFNPTTRKTSIWTMNGNKMASSAAGPVVKTGYQLGAVADVNHDGYSDYVLCNPSTGQTLIWYLNGATFTSARNGPTLPAGFALVAVADFDGDGQPDYLLFNSSTRQTQVLYLDSLTEKSSANGPTLPANWSLVAAGDFNADGQPDFVLFNSTTRQTSVWYMDGVKHTGGANVKVAPAGFVLQGVADYDADGNLDFVLANPSTGETKIWYLDGVTYKSAKNGPALTSGFNLVSP